MKNAVEAVRPYYNATAFHTNSALLRAGLLTEQVFYNGNSQTICPPPSRYGFGCEQITEDGRIYNEGIALSCADTDANLIIDVGAHVGRYAVLLGAFNNGELHCFEPEGRNRRILQSVLVANGIDASVHPHVVTDRNGSVEFFVDPRSGSESHSIKTNSDFETVRSPCISLRKFIEGKSPELAYAKIDAEGAEDRILPDLFDVNTPVEGLVELHPERIDGDTRELINECKSVFAVFREVGDTSPNHPHADTIDFPTNRPGYWFETHD